MKFPQVVHRIATDTSFANRLQEGPPQATLEAEGYALSDEGIAAVCDVLRNEGWEVLCSPEQAYPEESPWWIE